ncbi:MAG TPA: hypothetical protein VM223_15730 [Planctomycetota bacterium]|nr:hypothetical protein [Planctomycetota bacterium]
MAEERWPADIKGEHKVRPYSHSSEAVVPTRANTMVRPYGKAAFVVLAACLLAAGMARAATSPPGPLSKNGEGEGVRFTAVDVFIDSKDQPLAAWQIELTAKPDRTDTGRADTGVRPYNDVKIVGIEGGEHAAFKEPPYYDPAALNRNRVILAAFSTGQTLPTGRTRVARVHVQVSGTPEYQIKLIVAASADGKEIQATAAVGQGDEQ